jgi:hypothetical protein
MGLLQVVFSVAPNGALGPAVHGDRERNANDRLGGSIVSDRWKEIPIARIFRICSANETDTHPRDLGYLLHKFQLSRSRICERFFFPRAWRPHAPNLRSHREYLLAGVCS